MPAHRILIINPNSTRSMTDALKPLIENLRYSNTEYTLFTPQTGPPSINNSSDCSASASICMNELCGPQWLEAVEAYDGLLVACFSHHPLVSLLREYHMSVYRASPGIRPAPKVPVVGIFEAAIAQALVLLGMEGPDEEGVVPKWGIVTTGKQWEALLAEGVADVLGTGRMEQSKSLGFAGVHSTGLSAVELHSRDRGEVEMRVKEAAKRLCGEGKNVKVVVLGCAGMSGMEEWVREAAGEEVWIVDGVKAGVGQVQAMVRALPPPVK